MATRKRVAPSRKTKKKEEGSVKRSPPSLPSVSQAQAEAVAKAEAAAVAASTRTTARIDKGAIERAVARSTAIAEAAATAAAVATTKLILVPPEERAILELVRAFEASKLAGRLDDVKTLPVHQTTIHGERCLIKQIAFGFVLYEEDFSDIIATCVEAMHEVRDMLKVEHGEVALKFWSTLEWMKIGPSKGDGGSPGIEWKLEEFQVRIHRFFTGHPRVSERSYARELRLKLQEGVSGTPRILLQIQVGGRASTRKSKRHSTR